MPSVSRAQHGLMGAALAIKRGKARPKGKAAELARSMSVRSLKDYTEMSTKHLPMHKRRMRGY